MRRPAKGAPLEESTDCEKTALVQLKGHHALRKGFDGGGLWDTVSANPDLMDTLAFALTFYKTDPDIRACLADRGVPESIIQAALACDGFTKTSHLSTVALKKIIPHLEEGMGYSEACARRVTTTPTSHPARSTTN